MKLEQFTQKHVFELQSWFVRLHEDNRFIDYYSNPREWLELVSHTESRVALAAIVDARMIGFVDMEFDSTGDASFAFGVKPDLRGKGLGGKLLDKIIVYAAQHGAELIEAGVDKDNIACKRLLESQGFSVVGDDGGVAQYIKQIGQFMGVKQTVICSHGFGVTADSRGMFPEIAQNIPGAEFVMFDYNEVKPNGDTIVASLDEQAKKLQAQIDAATGEIVLLCHSQGSVIAGLADLSKVTKVILLAPPVNMSMQRVIGKMLNRPGSKINPDGLSELPRTDGTTTYLPKEYLESLDKYTPMGLYQKIAATVPTVIVRATHDAVVGLTNVNKINGATHYDIVADHNFSGESRRQLIEVIDKEMV